MSAASLAGPAVAAVILAAGSVEATFLLGAALIFVSLLISARLRNVADTPEPRRMERPGLAGFAALGRLPAARTIVTVTVGQRFIRGMLTVLVATTALQLLQLGDAGVGVLNAAIGFGMVLGMFPSVCHNGYQGTTARAPQDTSNVPMNTNARCTASPSTGTNVRGAQNVPQPGEGGGNNRTTVLTSYDPASRAVDGGPGVPEIRLGSTGGQQRVMGEDSWQWLMLGPLAK